MESFPTQLLVFPVIGPLCLGWENVLIQKVKMPSVSNDVLSSGACDRSIDQM